MIKNKNFIDTFIIGHSSDDDKLIVDGFMNNGANSFMLKPTTVNNFKGILKEYIESNAFWNKHDIKNML